MPDAITLLKADHDLVRDLLKELTNRKHGSPSERAILLDRIERELRVHMATKRSRSTGPRAT
jgi:hypothetical protein